MLAEKKSWSLPKLILAVVAVSTLVFVAFRANRESERTGVAAQERISQVSSPASQSERSRLTGNSKECVRKLQEQLETGRLALISVSRNGAYHYVDKKGRPAMKPLSSATKRDRAVETVWKNVPHRAYQSRSHSNGMTLLYRDNVVVTMDTTPNRCQVTGLFEATPRTGNIHPLVEADLFETMVNPDDTATICPKTYTIQGLASGGYLRYDTNFGKVLSHTGIDAAPSVADWEKWNITIMNVQTEYGIGIHYYKISSARQPVVFKDLTTTPACDPAAHLSGIAGKDYRAGIPWMMYEVVKSTQPVTLQLLSNALAFHGGTVVMYNLQCGKCLCINSANKNVADVTTCDCTHANAVLKFEETTPPTSLDLDEY